MQDEDHDIEVLLSDSEIPPFSADEWIGKNKKYPTDASKVPPELERYCTLTLEIPEQFRTLLLPDDNMTIDAFLRFQMPKESYDLVYPSAKKAFSPQPPNENIERLRTRVLPSRKFVEETRKAFGQAVLNGANSVVDPKYKESRIPLWVITFWRNAYEVVDATSRWRKSMAWLKAHQEPTATLPVIKKAENWLASLSWNQSIKIHGAATYTTTLHFTPLLSDGMITGTLVDMMVAYIAEQVQLDEELRSTVEIATLAFLNYIMQAKSPADFDKPRTKYMRKLEERIRRNNPTLYFPAHLEKQLHWLVFSINFEEKEFAYGKEKPIVRCCSLS